jgi:hypothetical protein
MTEPSDAYAALVDALIALRRDPATARFDEYLDYAVQAGRIDEPTARALRWWQRQSVRGVEEHLEGLLPVILNQLGAADQAAMRAADISEQAWWAAAGEHPPEVPIPPADPEPAQPEPATPAQQEPTQTESDVHDGPHLSPRDDVPREPVADSSLPQDGAPVQRTLTAGLTVIPEERI